MLPDSGFPESGNMEAGQFSVIVTILAVQTIELLPFSRQEAASGAIQRDSPFMGKDSDPFRIVSDTR